MNKKVFIPAMILLVAAIMMMASFAMPYVMGDSLFELMEEFYEMYEEGFEDGIVYLVFTVIAIFFTFLTLLFSAIRKPIPATIFDIFALVSYLILSIVPMDNGAEFEAGFFMFFIMGFVVFVTSIVLQIGRVITKNEKIRAQQASSMPYNPNIPNNPNFPNM